jgi:hypothetical protein
MKQRWKRCGPSVRLIGLRDMGGSGESRIENSGRTERYRKEVMEQGIDWHKELWSSGYARIDRERFRRKKGDFWDGINAIGPDGTIMMEWERRMGSALGLVMPFLKLTGEAQDYIACPKSTGCGCAHYVSETHRGELVATCQCTDEDSDCETYQLEPEDVLRHGLDWHLFSDEVRKALGFAPPSGAAYVSSDLREIGSYAALAAPVYLCLAGRSALLRELVKLQGLREGPFLVLTATGTTWSEEVEAMARPHGGGHISLSSVLVPEGSAFRVMGALSPMLEEFAKRLAKGKGLATMVQRIDGNLQVIATNAAELQRKNADLLTAKLGLEKMFAEGMFAFTKKVDAHSFKILCMILAEGDVAKASRSLGVADQTLRDELATWRDRGGPYALMLDCVRWRKRVGRTEKVRLNDNVLLGRAAPAENPALLSEVLQGLGAMTANNWQELSDELAEMLRAELQ